MRDRAFFHNLARVTGKSDKVIFSEMCLCEMFPLNFGNHSDLGSGFEISTGFALAVICTLHVLLFELASDSFRIFFTSSRVYS